MAIPVEELFSNNNRKIKNNFDTNKIPYYFNTNVLGFLFLLLRKQILVCNSLR